MHTLIRSSAKIGNMAKVTAMLQAEGRENVAVHGANGAIRSVLAATAVMAKKRPVLIVASSRDSLEMYRNDLALLCPSHNIIELPVGDATPTRAVAHSLELARQRTEALSRLAGGEPVIVLAMAEAAVMRVPAPQKFFAGRITLVTGETVDREKLLSRLVDFGYERIDRVDSVGHFSNRGGIIDIFSVNLESPVRIELFGDVIDSVREFHPVTQRSIKMLEKVSHCSPPSIQSIWQADSTVLSYLPADSGAVIFDEAARCEETVEHALSVR